MAETGYWPNPADPHYSPPAVPVSLGGELPSSEIFASTVFLGPRRLFSAMLSNNTGATVVMLIMRGTTLPVQGAALGNLQNVVATIPVAAGEQGWDDWADGYDFPTGFCIAFVTALTGTVDLVDLATDDSLSPCAVSYT